MNSINTVPLELIPAWRRKLFARWMRLGVVLKAFLIGVSFMTLMLVSTLFFVIIHISDAFVGVGIPIGLIIMAILISLHFANKNAIRRAYQTTLALNGLKELKDYFSVGFEYKGIPIEVTYSDSATPFTAMTIATIQLKRPFPNIVLDNRRNDKHLSSLVGRYGASQLISLEGDFDKYYDTYIPNGVQVDGLSILSPNVMQRLIHANQAFDIVMNGPTLQISSPGIVTADPVGLQETLLVAMELIDATEHSQRHHLMSPGAHLALKGDADDMGVRLGKIRFGVNQMIIAIIAAQALTIMGLTLWSQIEEGNANPFIFLGMGATLGCLLAPVYLMWRSSKRK